MNEINRREVRIAIRETLEDRDAPPRSELTAVVAAEGYPPEAVRRELDELVRVGLLYTAGENNEVKVP